MEKIKLVCIKDFEGSVRVGDIVETSKRYPYLIGKNGYLIWLDNEYLIPLSEWRERQIDSILYGED